MNLKIINFGLLRPTLDAATIAKYKRWAKYFGIGTSTTFVAVTAGLLAYKSQRAGNPIVFPAHMISYTNRSFCTDLRIFLSSIPSDMIDEYAGAQSRCSGIELYLQLVSDLSAFDSSIRCVDEYLRWVRSKLLAYPDLADLLNWDDLKAQNSVSSAVSKLQSDLLVAVHKQQSDANQFVPHLTRVPRDVDGKLVVNKDAGCSPPFLLDSDPASRSQSVSSLHANGFVLLKNLVSLEAIGKLRDQLNIESSYSKNPIPFETRSVDLQKVFAGSKSDGVDFIQLAPGRHVYRLRCSELESLVKPIHAPAMPVVWQYLAEQNGNSPQQSTRRVFLSEVSLVISDPLSGSDSWHATNGSSGVVVVVPLTPYFAKSGNMSVLAGSHKKKFVPMLINALERGGSLECQTEPGDILVMDARLMRMTAKNELFNKSTVSLVFHYDFTDRPAPSQWITQTVWRNALATLTVWLSRYYDKVASR